MDVSYKTIEKELKENKIRKLYQLVGENGFVKKEIVKTIERKIVEKGFEEINEMKVYGNECKLAHINWIYSKPVGKGMKFLVIKEGEKLKNEMKESLRKCSETPPKLGVIVLITEKPILKEIPVIQCWNFFPEEAIERVKVIAKREGVKIPEEEALLLYDSFDKNMECIATEIKKLSNFIYPRKEINKKDIQQIISGEVGGSVFDFTHSVVRGEIKNAYKELDWLSKLGYHEMRLIWQIHRHIEMLVLLKEKKEINIHKYYLGKYRYEANMWKKENLLKVMGEVFRTEFKIKTGKIKKEFGIKELVYRIWEVKNENNIN